MLLSSQSSIFSVFRLLNYISTGFAQLRNQYYDYYYSFIFSVILSFVVFVVVCVFLQGDAPPYNTIPIPKITQPQPPPKSKCQQEDVESVSSMKAASFTLVLSLFGFVAIFL